MSTIQDLITFVWELGNNGDDLKQFVSTEQALQREEREKERRERREKEEAKREEREKEREEREKERQHTLILQYMKGGTAGNTSNSSSPSVDNVSRFTLPLYREGEDIASYFIRFEPILLCFTSTRVILLSD